MHRSCWLALCLSLLISAGAWGQALVPRVAPDAKDAPPLVCRQQTVNVDIDNQIARVVPMETVTQYAPIYSLNERGWRMHALPQISLGNVTIAAGGTLAEFASGQD